MPNSRDYFDYLNEKIEISPANSQEELESGELIQRLMESHGLETTLQDFVTPAAGDLTHHLVYLVMVVGMLLSGVIASAVGVVGLLLVLASFALLTAEFAGYDVLGNLGPRARSQNIIGVHRATGPLVVKGNRPIVIVAHYDSPNENPLFGPQLAKYQVILKKSSYFCAAFVALCALVQVMAFIPSAARHVFWALGIIGSLPLLTLAVCAIYTRFAPCTNGANDNKSSIAALLGVLDAVRPAQDEAKRYMAEHPYQEPEPNDTISSEDNQDEFGLEVNKQQDDQHLSAFEDSLEALPLNELSSQDELTQTSEPQEGVEFTQANQTAQDAQFDELHPKSADETREVTDDTTASDVQEDESITESASEPANVLPEEALNFISWNGVRRGADFMRSLKILPAECELVYQDPPVPAVNPQSLPEIPEFSEADFKAELEKKYGLNTEQATDGAPERLASGVSSTDVANAGVVSFSSSEENVASKVPVAYVDNASILRDTNDQEEPNPYLNNDSSAAAENHRRIPEFFLRIKDSVENLGKQASSSAEQYAATNEPLSTTAVGSHKAQQFENVDKLSEQAVKSKDVVEEPSYPSFDDEYPLAEYELIQDEYVVHTEQLIDASQSSSDEPFDQPIDVDVTDTQLNENAQEETQEETQINASQEASIEESPEDVVSTETEADVLQDTVQHARVPVSLPEIPDKVIDLPEITAADDTYQTNVSASQEDNSEASDVLTSDVAVEAEAAIDTEAEVIAETEADVDIEADADAEVDTATEADTASPLVSSGFVDNVKQAWQSIVSLFSGQTSEADQAYNTENGTEEATYKDAQFESLNDVSTAESTSEAHTEVNEQLNAEQVSDEQLSNEQLSNEQVNEEQLDSEQLEATTTFEAIQEEEPLDKQLDTKHVNAEHVGDEHVDTEHVGDEYVDTEHVQNQEVDTDSVDDDPQQQDIALALPIRSFSMDVEPTESEMAQKDTSGLDTLSQDGLPHVSEAGDQAPRPAEINDPSWGTSEFVLDNGDMARRASLLDVPNPDGESTDPFASTPDDNVEEENFESTSIPIRGTAPVKSQVRISNSAVPRGTRESIGFITGSELNMRTLGSHARALEPRPQKKHFLWFDKKKDESTQQHEDESSQGEAKRRGDWKGGATTRSNFHVVGDEKGEFNTEDSHDLVNDAQFIDLHSPEEAQMLREAILSMGDDELVSHDIWFVALGGSSLRHAGMKEFLQDFRRDIRGAFLINLHAVGSGTLTVLTSEGESSTRRADRRLVRLVLKTAEELGITLDRKRYDWDSTDATAAMKDSLRSVTIMGMDENRLPALSATPEDVPENVDRYQIDRVSALIAELIRRA